MTQDLYFIPLCFTRKQINSKYSSCRNNIVQKFGKTLNSTFNYFIKVVCMYSNVKH